MVITGIITKFDFKGNFYGIDYKKEERKLYRTPKKPQSITVPSINYVAIRGRGNPNEKDGAYQRAIQKLYALSYTIKMSKKGEPKLPGYFDYVVQPLEGFWWIPGQSFDFADKDKFEWISMFRLPEFVTPEIFELKKRPVTRNRCL